MADRSVKVTLSANVAQYSAAMKRAGADTAGVTKKTSMLSQQIKQTFTTGAVFAGIAAVGAAMKKTFTLGLTFTEQMNTLGAVTHATDGQMKTATETAKALGNAIDIPNTSAADAADAMVELAKGGLTMQQSMQAARGTLMLAAAAQVSGAQAATTQAQALNAFNLSADKAGHVADVLANTANAASGEIGDFANALAYTGGVANSFGISIDDTAAMLAIFAKNGIEGSMAGTTLRSMLVHLAAPSKQAEKALDDLGVSVYDAQGNFVGLEKLSGQLAAAQKRMTPAAFQAAAAIAFGQRAVQGAIVAAKAGPQAFDAMTDAIGRTGGAADLANAKMKGLPGTLQRAVNEAENVALTLFQRITPAVESMVEGFTGFVRNVGPAVVSVFGTVFDALNFGFTVIGKVVDVFRALPGPVKAFGAALVGLALAQKIGLIARLSSAFDTVRIRAMYAGQALGSMRSTFGRVGTAARNASRTVVGAFGGPWGIAIAGAATGIGLLIKKWQDAQPAVRDFTDAVDANTGALADNAAQAAAAVLSQDLTQWAKLGGDVGVYTAAVLGNADAQRKMNGELSSIAANLARQAGVYSDNADTFERAGITRREVLTAVRKGILGNDSAWGALVTRLNDARVPFGDINRANADINNTFGKLQPVIDQYRVNVQGLNDDLEEAQVEHKAAAGAAELMGDATEHSSQAAHDSQGAYDTARKALNGYSSSAVAATANVEGMSDAMRRTVGAASAMLQSALQTRQSIASALTGFVSPLGAWDEATRRVRQSFSAAPSGGGSSSGTNPAVAAAEAAVKAGRRRAEETKRSAKAERDAAVDAAKKIRDAIIDKGEADTRETKLAEQHARDRVRAAKDEAEELRRLVQQRQQAVKDSEHTLRDAEFRKRAADLAVAAARRGLESAQNPRQRAAWEAALNQALTDRKGAVDDLTSAQGKHKTKVDKLTDAKDASKKATNGQKRAENNYAEAQKTAASTAETASDRKSRAEDAYARAKEQADNRYNKSVDAVKDMLQRLIDKQDAVKSSAQDMSSGAVGSVQNMASGMQPSLEDYLQTLQDQVTAQQKWHDNIVKLANKLPTDVALELAQLGPKSAPLVAELVNGTDRQLDKFAALFPKSTDKGVQDMVNSIVRAIVPVGDNAVSLSNTMIEKFLEEFSSAKTNEQAQQAVADLQAAMQAQANRQPIVIYAKFDAATANQQMADAFGPGYNPASFWGQAPKYATGGEVKDGWFWSGDAGPELGYKSGSSVRLWSNAESMRIAPAASAGTVVNQQITVNYPAGTPAAVATNQALEEAAIMAGN